jgi:hypothetical protein
MSWPSYYGHHRVVLQLHKKEVFYLGKGLQFTNGEYSILVTWLVLQIVELRIKNNIRMCC